MPRYKIQLGLTSSVTTKVIKGRVRFCASIGQSGHVKETYIQRSFETEELAKKFLDDYYEAIRNGQTPVIKTLAETQKKNFQLAQAAFVKLEHAKLSFVTERKRLNADGSVYRRYIAFVRTIPGVKRWKRKSFPTEAEANVWIKVCMTALLKAKVLKEQEEKEQQRIERELLDSIEQAECDRIALENFNEEAYGTKVSL